MRTLPILAVLAFAPILPVSALDITGNVLDKLDNPITGASVCIKSDPTSCVTTDAAGAFHLAKAIAVRNPGPGAIGFSLAYARGSLIVRSPSSVAARVEWLSADGRHPLATKDVNLSAGPNALALPAGLPHAGLCILRVSTADQILTWKAVLASGSASGSASSGTPRIASLSKAAAVATLEISKTGYRTRTYDPSAETETDALIYLSLTSDVGLTFGGTLSQKVLSIDHTKKTIIRETTDAHCDSATNAVVHETTQDTQKYVVRGGNLWTWYDGDCTGEMFTGTATDIVGTWTLVDPSALLPSDLRTGCASDSSGNGESSFESFSAQYVISETQITGTLTAESCPGDYFGYIFAYAFAADTTVNLTKNTCAEIGFTNGKGETSTFDFTKKGDTLHTAYSFKTSTCAMDMYFGLTPKDPSCPEGHELTPFLTCLDVSGFAAKGPVAKVSAYGTAPLPMSRARRAPPVFAKVPKSGWFAPLREAGFREGYISRLWKAAAPRK